MAESMTNGTADISVDVEMKEEAVPVEEPLAGIQEAADPTDPQPPPQVVPIQGESLPPLHPPARSAAATPPVHSAATTRPNSIPPQPSVKPDKPAAHGGPTRQYLNQNITPHLLEGMKHLAFYEPEKPLLWLADFLRDRSKEIEG